MSGRNTLARKDDSQFSLVWLARPGLSDLLLVNPVPLAAGFGHQ